MSSMWFVNVVSFFKFFSKEGKFHTFGQEKRNLTLNFCHHFSNYEKILIKKQLTINH